MKEKLAKLIDVKSLVTLVMVFGFVVFTAISMTTSKQVPEGYTQILTTIVSFYFGVKYAEGKKEVGDINENNN